MHIHDLTFTKLTRTRTRQRWIGQDNILGMVWPWPAEAGLLCQVEQHKYCKYVFSKHAHFLIMTTRHSMWKTHQKAAHKVSNTYWWVVNDWNSNTKRGQNINMKNKRSVLFQNAYNLDNAESPESGHVWTAAGIVAGLRAIVKGRWVKTWLFARLR